MQHHPAQTEARFACKPTLQRERPPLKWTGGKIRLLPQLSPLLPHGRRLIEPFVGAGAVFLNHKYSAYLLSDANIDLMTMWRALRDHPAKYINDAEALFGAANHSEAAYLRIREEFNGATDAYERAVRLPYLNRNGFNGLYRVNRQGVYNVPYGKPKAPAHFPLGAFERASVTVRRATLMDGGFALAMALAGAGDVVYCDPPYSPSVAGNSFANYTAHGFGLNDHEDLVRAARDAHMRGATVLISNHDTPETRALYSGFTIHSLQVHRTVAADASARGSTAELVAVLP